MNCNKKKLAVGIMWIAFGVALLVMQTLGMVDNSVYSGVGGA